MNNTIIQGLWRQNPASVQLLGLCPLLAVSQTLWHATALGLATLLVLMLSMFFVSTLRSAIPSHLRIPIFVMVIAAWVTILQAFIAAYHYPLYESLGIFLALITTNCVILARIETIAYHNPPWQAGWDGLWQGLGFLWVLALFGGLREIIGQGTLIEWQFFSHYEGFLLMRFPVGAFILLGFLLAFKNVFSQRASS